MARSNEWDRILQFFYELVQTRFRDINSFTRYSTRRRFYPSWRKKARSMKGKKGDVGKVFETVVKSIFRCLEKPRFPRKFSNTRGDDSMKEINKKSSRQALKTYFFPLKYWLSIRWEYNSFFFFFFFLSSIEDETDGSNKIFQTNMNDSHIRMNVATRSSEHFEYL